MYGGKTVEVLNTDAEGRLVLADALVPRDRGEARRDPRRRHPDRRHASSRSATGSPGMMGNDDALVDARRRPPATRAGEALWPLPIPEEMPSKVRTDSKVADLRSTTSTRWGGALFAAAFLREFVGEPAGGPTSTSPARRSTPARLRPRHPRRHRLAVATLVEYARSLAG